MIIIPEYKKKISFLKKVCNYFIRIFNFFFINFVIKMIFFFNKKNLTKISYEDKCAIKYITNELNSFDINLEDKKFIFFIFFTDSESKFWTIKDRDNNLDHELLIDYERYISKNFPDASLLLFTDKKTILPTLSHFNIIDINLTKDAVIYNKSLVFYSFIKSKLFKRNTIYSDFDVIVNFNIEKFSKKNDFDIAYTFRKNNLIMPINTGISFYNQKNKNKILDLLYKNLCDFNAMANSHLVKFFYGPIKSDWWGDQISLTKTFNFTKFTKFKTGDILFINGCDIKLLNCDEYNFSPVNPGNYTIEFLRNIKVIHLKGWLKSYFKIIASKIQ